MKPLNINLPKQIMSWVSFLTLKYLENINQSMYLYINGKIENIKYNDYERKQQQQQKKEIFKIYRVIF